MNLIACCVDVLQTFISFLRLKIKHTFTEHLKYKTEKHNKQNPTANPSQNHLGLKIKSLLPKLNQRNQNEHNHQRYFCCNSNNIR